PHRTRFRRDLNALTRKFAVRFERVATEPERQEVLSALMRFHDQRWSGRGGSTAFGTPALRAFHHAATERALECGWLRLYVLRLNDVPAAVAYCFSRDGRFYLYQHGFDERFHRHSVGYLMVGLAIREAIDEGAREFDML